MGRGRAKAKQTKVARELKYSSGNTDLTALQAELTGGPHHKPVVAPVTKDADDEDDPYAKYRETEDDSDE